MKQTKTLFPRKYYPKSFRPTAWKAIKPYYQDLLKSPIPNARKLKEWLLKWSELESIVSEESTNREIAMTCNTESKKIKKKHLDFVQNIDPEVKRLDFELAKKYYNCPYRKKLGSTYIQFDKMVSSEIELFREENVGLETEADELCQQYQEIAGSWMVKFDGKNRTFPKMGKYLKVADRSVREQAWRTMAERRLKDAKKLDSIYDAMLKKRDRIARQANLPDYRAYIFKENMREYTPDDCLEFHEAVEKAVVPLVKEIYEKRRITLGLGSISTKAQKRCHSEQSEGSPECTREILRNAQDDVRMRKVGQEPNSLAPWDLECDPQGFSPLKPFSKIIELQDGVEEIFGRIDPRLKKYFHSIRAYQDLDSRKGKAPGGYQATLPEQRIPFIFTNAANLQGDVETLLHEGGHAFHTLQSRNQKLIAYRDAPMEFCEVASMSQELLGGEHNDVFYKKEEDAIRARREHLESVLELFPWVMTVDAFQHWVYTHPKHTANERGQEWVKQHNRFNAGVDWNCVGEKVQSRFWQKQLHIFLSPFYYIEYAISQLGSLQIYRNYKKNKKTALSKFLSAMSLGASRSCKDIYKEAGIEFRFDLEFVKELTELVMEELNGLR